MPAIFLLPLDLSSEHSTYPLKDLPFAVTIPSVITPPQATPSGATTRYYTPNFFNFYFIFYFLLFVFLSNARNYLILRLRSMSRLLRSLNSWEESILLLTDRTLQKSTSRLSQGMLMNSGSWDFYHTTRHSRT
jgi:hypothetical protein